MKTLRRCILAPLFAFTACTGTMRQDTSTQPLVIRGATVVDATSRVGRKGMTILIEGRRIVRMMPDDSLPMPRNARVIDAAGLYLVPGLWDMHVHPTEADELPRFLASGITSVRDMGGDFARLRGWRSAIDSGKLAGPRILTSGSAVESPSDLEFLRSHGVPPDQLSWRVTVADSAAAEAAIDSLARLGVDFVKARNFASPAVFFAVAAAAKRHGLMFVGHPPFGLNIPPDVVADAGMRTMEHGYFPYQIDRLKPEELARIVEAYRRNQTILVPTLLAWSWRVMTLDSIRQLGTAGHCPDITPAIQAKLQQSWAQNLKFRTEGQAEETVSSLVGWHRALDRNERDLATLHHAGIPILAGSDEPAFACPGDALVRELALFVERLGITPYDAIVSATLAPAALFGLEDSLGTIQPGKLADLVLIEGDPLTDISQLSKVRAVVANGHYHPRLDLLNGINPPTTKNLP